MILIDSYTRISETKAVAEKQFSPGDFGCTNGFVLEPILIECMAQTVAAHHGFKALKTKETRPSKGMLVSVDSFEFFHPVPHTTAISIAISKTDEIGPFHLISGEIKTQDTLLAKGTIKIFNQQTDSGIIE